MAVAGDMQPDDNIRWHPRRVPPLGSIGSQEPLGKSFGCPCARITLSSPAMRHAFPVPGQWRPSGHCSRRAVAPSARFAPTASTRAASTIPARAPRAAASPSPPARSTTCGASTPASSAFPRARRCRSIRSNACCSRSCGRPSRMPACVRPTSPAPRPASMSAPRASTITSGCCSTFPPSTCRR